VVPGRSQVVSTGFQVLVLSGIAFLTMQPFLLSTLSLRAMQSPYRVAQPVLIDLHLSPSLIRLHGLPQISLPQTLTRKRRLPWALRLDYMRHRIMPRIPLNLGVGNWTLPSSMQPLEALRLSSTLALRLPPDLGRGPSLPELLTQILQNLGRVLADPCHGLLQDKRVRMTDPGAMEWGSWTAL